MQDVINRYELGKKGLDIEEQKLIKDVILGMLEIASKGAGAALGAKVGKTSKGYSGTNSTRMGRTYQKRKERPYLRTNQSSRCRRGT